MKGQVYLRQGNQPVNGPIAHDRGAFKTSSKKNPGARPELDVSGANAAALRRFSGKSFT
jgi:hypothetical protein